MEPFLNNERNLMDTKDPNTELSEAAEVAPDFTPDQLAHIDRIADASMLAHRTVRIVNDAIEWLTLAAAVFGKYAAIHQADALAANGGQQRQQ